MSLPSQPAFRILLVDEDKGNRDFLKAQLEGLPGIRAAVSTAEDGDRCLESLKGEPADLVFLEYRIPPTDGLEILDRIRQLHPKTAVVMMTASGNEQIAVSAMKKGAMDYLTHKDLRQVDLSQLLRRVIELRALVNQNMELRQVNQMKNEFIANVSHELRTPLTVVIGYAHTMRDGSLGALNEPQKKALTAVIDRAEGLLVTLNNILRIREVHEGVPQLMLKPVELKALVERRLEKAGKEFRRKELTLETILPKAPAFVMADEDKLGDVLDNLLSNAAKFSPQKGPLVVELHVLGQQAAFSVADRGPGIPPELMPHLFDPFFAAGQGPTREYAGLGLGLPLSKQIVERLSGRIWLESGGAGKGATARLELPVCAPEAAPVVVEGEDALRKKTVLIVEDNPDLVEVLMLFLASVSRNLSIVTAKSGFECLDRAQEGTPDLIILDVMMPGMDGLEVLSRLKRLPGGERIPVMVLTGYSDALTRARQAGAREVLLKPFEKNVFVRKVLQLLQSQHAEV